MMREGKPELYFLLILYQKFFDLSNPNFGNIPICGGLPFSQTRRMGRYVAVFSGKSRYGEQSLDAQEKLRIGLGCGNSVRGVRPRPAENPHLLVYHISVNLSIGNLHKKKRAFQLSFTMQSTTQMTENCLSQSRQVQSSWMFSPLPPQVSQHSYSSLPQ